MILRNARLTSVLGVLALAGAGSLLGGCGGLAPGDYVVYKVALDEPDKSSGCYYPETGPDPNTKSDSSTARAAAIWTLTAGPDDVFYLDTGKAVLEGQASDDGYTFDLKTVDVTYDNDDPALTKHTDTETVSLTMTVDGDAVSGSVTDKISHKCSGSNCGNPIPSCTSTTDFTGSEVGDVELKHEVN
jgi:hypothetical protein